MRDLALPSEETLTSSNWPGRAKAGSWAVTSTAATFFICNWASDAADKVRVARLIEKDDRRALGMAVVDDDVDLITR